MDSIGAAVARGSVVLTAAPGAGKSTLVPLAVAKAVAGTTLVLEPRRLAAKATATRMAALLGEPLGRTVGMTVRGERKASPRTRIEVMTEAILTQRLHSDPDLSGVGAIIFDEFHERNLHSDLGLAMAIEARGTLRPDLRLVVMSATMDAKPVARLLGDAEVFEIPGQVFPVRTYYLSRPPPRKWVSAVTNTVDQAVREVLGDILVFVPGRGEITRVGTAISRLPIADRLEVIGLHGGSNSETHAKVLSPERSRQRVIVATAVAETSVTIPGIEAVVDGGLLRRAIYHPDTGLGRLETVHATRFAADQRRGRAGRLSPGVCFRLWSEADDALLDDSTVPEILDGDPVPIAFELLRWGDPDGLDLPLLDHPGRERLLAGRRILETLGLCTSDGTLSQMGVAASQLRTHPRIAALVLAAARHGMEELGAKVGAILESDIRATNVDLEMELDERSEARPLQNRIQQLLSRLPDADSALRDGLKGAEPQSLGGLLALAWPDRVAIARPGREGHFLLAAGREVEVSDKSELRRSEFIVVAEADGSPTSGRIRRAATIERGELLSIISPEWEKVVRWDDRAGDVVSEYQQRIGAIVLHRKPDPNPTAEEALEALIAGVKRNPSMLRWPERAAELRLRLAWLHEVRPAEWPDVSDDALVPYLDSAVRGANATSLSKLQRVNLRQLLLEIVPWQMQGMVDSLAPSEVAIPGGRTAPIDYSSGRPVLSVQIQRLFGMDVHPTIGPNEEPLTIELLSPARRPAQTTRDLPGFWRGSYAAVRADLRGRYPKHKWPEHPY